APCSRRSTSRGAGRESRAPRTAPPRLSRNSPRDNMLMASRPSTERQMSTDALPAPVRIAMVVAFLVVAGIPARAQDHGGKSSLVFVENTNGGDVSIIDATTLRVVGTIPIGLSPDDIVAAPAGDVL